MNTRNSFMDDLFQVVLIPVMTITFLSGLSVFNMVLGGKSLFFANSWPGLLALWFSIFAPVVFVTLVEKFGSWFGIGLRLKLSLGMSLLISLVVTGAVESGEPTTEWLWAFLVMVSVSHFGIKWICFYLDTPNLGR